MKVLIIEDEKLAQEELKRLLQLVDGFEIQVLDCLETVEDAVEWFECRSEPDLIFMDIKLSDGLSFEIFDRIKITCPVIFVTAFDGYALRAFKMNTIDYLLKPTDKIQIEAALNKLKLFQNLPASQNDNMLDSSQVKDLLKMNLEAIEYKRRFVIRTGDKLRHVSVDDIAYFYSENDYTYLVAKENAKFIIDFKLEELDALLDPNEFFRVSRKFIANIHSIKLVNKYFNSRLELIMSPEPKDQILISRVRVPKFIEWLER